MPKTTPKPPPLPSFKQLHSIEVEHHPNPDDRTVGRFEVFLYDDHAICLQQFPFYYTKRADRRVAKTQAINLAERFKQEHKQAYKQTIHVAQSIIEVTPQ